MVLSVIWYALFAVPAMYMVHELMPKVPLYQVQVMNFPWLTWRGGDIETILQTHVVMDNVNYVKTDIHAIAFDVYFPTWDGTLHHIGHVRDKAHYLASTQHQTLHPPTTTTTVIATPKTPLWTMHARRQFQIYDDMHMRISPWAIFKALGHLLWQILRGKGTITIPATAVAHVKASNSAKVTISITCDNELNVFSMKMQGKKCSMDKLATGWIPIGEEATRLRTHTLRLTPIEDGRILPEELQSLTPLLQKTLRQEQLDALLLV